LLRFSLFETVSLALFFGEFLILFSFVFLHVLVQVLVEFSAFFVVFLQVLVQSLVQFPAFFVVFSSVFLHVLV
jgi:hypothetical protein